MPASSFAELTRQGVERFIQTVLVIDNELTLDMRPVPPLPEVLVPPSSLRDTTRLPLAVVVDPPREEEPSSPLDAKRIMDAFLKRSMICGMHKPISGGDLVGEAIKAARRSDAVIVDWMLEPSKPSAAKEIIEGILDGDDAENGRLRLIVVYTSQPDVVEVARQIREHLTGKAFRDDKPGTLTKANVRIVVLNKEGTPGALAPVGIEALPDRIFEEFAFLSAGVLSTFAVSAIAAIRRDTHHVLAIFSRDMDGAFLGHMCALGSPEDAKEFILDLLAGELRNVASMNPETGAVLAAENLALQIDAISRGDHLRYHDILVPRDLAREFPAKGKAGVAASASRQKDGKGAPAKSPVTVRNVGFLFDDDPARAETAHRRFARFASFRTEPSGRTVPPSDWAPGLSLGSLIVEMAADGTIGEYLLCTQPRCDAVRLDGVRSFPFQRVTVANGPSFDLVAAVPGNLEQAHDVLLNVSAKPYDGRLIDFSPSADQRVRAVRVDGGRFEFRDAEGKAYVWLGDLRDLGAQRTASRVASRMHEPGLDEFEWLRLKADKKKGGK